MPMWREPGGTIDFIYPRELLRRAFKAETANSPFLDVWYREKLLDGEYDEAGSIPGLIERIAGELLEKYLGFTEDDYRDDAVWQNDDVIAARDVVSEVLITDPLLLDVISERLNPVLIEIAELMADLARIHFPDGSKDALIAAQVASWIAVRLPGDWPVGEGHGWQRIQRDSVDDWTEWIGQVF